MAASTSAALARRHEMLTPSPHGHADLVGGNDVVGFGAGRVPGSAFRVNTRPETPEAGRHGLGQALEGLRIGQNRLQLDGLLPQRSAQRFAHGLLGHKPRAISASPSCLPVFFAPARRSAVGLQRTRPMCCSGGRPAAWGAAASAAAVAVSFIGKAAPANPAVGIQWL